MEGGKNGTMEEWKSGRMEGWNGGRMEKCGNSTPDSYRGDNGRVEEWKNGKFTTETRRTRRWKEMPTANCLML